MSKPAAYFQKLAIVLHHSQHSSLPRGLVTATAALVLRIVGVELVGSVVVVLAGRACLTPGTSICLAIGVQLIGTVILACFVLHRRCTREPKVQHVAIGVKYH